jgi:hypothetical protein
MRAMPRRRWGTKQAVIAPEVADADEAYRQVTVEDGGVAVGRYFRIEPDDGWLVAATTGARASRRLPRRSGLS